MKPPTPPNTQLLFVLVLALASCAEAAQYSSKPTNSRDYTAVGEVIIRIDSEKDLPNPSGALELPGGTVDRGYTELVYLGLNSSTQPKFLRRDADIAAGAATLADRSLGLPIRKLAQPPVRAAMEFSLDYSEGRHILLRGYTVEIIQASQAGVTFTVLPRP